MDVAAGAPTVQGLAHYLERLNGRPVRILDIAPLAPNGSLRGHDGPALRIDYEMGGRRLRAILERGQFFAGSRGEAGRGEDALRAGRRAPARLPHEARTIDFGAVDRAGALVSLGRAEDFFVLEDGAEGRAYGDDLAALADRCELLDLDTARCDVLCDWLLAAHCEAGADPSLYPRRLRVLVGASGGIMGLADALAATAGPLSGVELEDIERRMVAWRWRIRGRAHRLRRVHGDFRPDNVVFRDGCDFTVLGRGPDGWGEPADDVATLTLGYVVHGIRRPGVLDGALKALFRRFWASYLEGSRDAEILEVAPPFLAHRALDIVARQSPGHGCDPARRTLARFVVRILRESVFDPERIDEYLAG